jgi:hypothetical protein
MAYRFSVDDVRFLTSGPGRDAVREVASLAPGRTVADVTKVRSLVGERFAAVLETVLLQRKAAAKLSDVDGWLFTDAALQQATPTLVAQHRASRFGGRRVHDVTCSIGTELVTLPAAIGSDIDPVRLAMARHNCPQAPLLQADALRPVTRDVAVLADPARRDSAGRRKWNPRDLAPPLDELAEVYADRDLAVKCAPGLDFDAVGWAAEIEVISLDRHVREACLWTRSLARSGRSATVLSTDGPQWTITDAEPDDCAVTDAQEWIVDPDGAVVRAGLVRQYAARHGLSQLDERIAYLTGPRPPAGIRAFRVLETVKYTEKALRQALRARQVGRVEILTRGVDVDPNTLRPRLKPRGDNACSVIITRIGRAPFAFLCDAN